MTETTPAVISADPLDLFRPQPLNFSSLEIRAEDTPSSRISRPSSDYIGAKNAALAELFENNTGLEASKVLEDLMRKLGGNVLDLSWTDLSQRRLNGLKLPYANLRCAILNSTELNGADLRGTNLTEALGRRTLLSGVNLLGANCTGASLPEADLTNAKLQAVDWTDANISDSIISGAIFAGGILCRTALVNCSFSPDQLPIVGNVTRLGSVYTSGGAVHELFLN